MLDPGGRLVRLRIENDQRPRPARPAESSFARPASTERPDAEPAPAPETRACSQQVVSQQGHRAAFLSAVRTSRSSVGSGPTSASALATAAAASVGRKPRLASAERASWAWLPAGMAGAAGAERDAAGLVLELVDDALGELGADALGAARSSRCRRWPRRGGPRRPTAPRGCRARRGRRRPGPRSAGGTSRARRRWRSRPGGSKSSATSISVWSTTSSPIAPSAESVREEAETR